MKIIKCSHCGTRYSLSEQYCPLCGNIETEKENHTLRNMILSIVLAIIFISIGCTTILGPRIKEKYDMQKAYLAESSIVTSDMGATSIPDDYKTHERTRGYCYYTSESPFFKRTPGVSDEQAQMEAMKCFENEDYEGLAKWYIHYTLNLPDDAENVAYQFSNLIVARQFYSVLQEKAKNKDPDIKYETGSMIYLSAHAYSNAKSHLKKQDAKDYEAYELMMEEAYFYIKYVCDLDENELHFWKLRDNELLMDYYTNKALIKIYKDLYNKTVSDIDVQVTLTVIKNNAEVYYRVKDFDKLADCMEVAELADQMPYHKKIADIYTDMRIVDSHFDIVTQDKPDDIRSDIDSMVFFSTMVINNTQTMVEDHRRDIDLTDLKNDAMEFAQKAFEYMYQEFGFDQEDIYELLNMTEWSGEEWDHYLDKAEKNIREKYYD